MITGYVGMFGDHKKNVQSPIDKDARPDLDKADLQLINADCITKCQSVVGMAQWTNPLKETVRLSCH
jgi:hypothetical protein